MTNEPLPAQGPVDVTVSRLEQENRDLRHMLFLAHGSETHRLYGDDGERTCNTCWIDFNTDSPEVMRQKMHAHWGREIAKLQAEGKDPFEFMRLKTANVGVQGPAACGRSPGTQK